jgi:hypothetical protein
VQSALFFSKDFFEDRPKRVRLAHEAQVCGMGTVDGAFAVIAEQVFSGKVMQALCSRCQ